MVDELGQGEGGGHEVGRGKGEAGGKAISDNGEVGVLAVLHCYYGASVGKWEAQTGAAGGRRRDSMAEGFCRISGVWWMLLMESSHRCWLREMRWRWVGVE